MTVPIPVPFLVILIVIVVVAVAIHLIIKSRCKIYRMKLDDALHKKAEISNFLSLFSQNLKNIEDIDNSMNMTARYVADLVEADSVCIFFVEDGFLRASGVSGIFPQLYKTSKYIFTKPRYILESLKRDKIKLGEGLLGEIAENKDSIYLEHASDNHFIAELDSSVPIRTLIAVPMIYESSVTGVICAVNNRNRDIPFSPEQFSNLKFIASQVVLAQNIIQVYSSMSEQQRINQELEFARELQSSLLPKQFPAWDQFLVHSFTRSAKEVSGDFYDFVEIDDDRLLIVVGDACGKGIPACMIMAMTRSFIRSNAHNFVNLKELLIRLNDDLYRDTEEEMFITLACCLLNKKESTIEYARAGHTELFIHVRKHNRKIFPQGTALGLLPSEIAEFDTLCVEFSPDMSIMLFTDGINEAYDEYEEEFGVERLAEEFKSSCLKSDSPEMIIDNILKSVDNFTGDFEQKHQSDDQTIVIIKHL